MRARPVAAIVAAVAVLGALGYARSQSRPRAAEAGEKDRLVVTTTVKPADHGERNGSGGREGLDAGDTRDLRSDSVHLWERDRR